MLKKAALRIDFDQEVATGQKWIFSGKREMAGGIASEDIAAGLGKFPPSTFFRPAHYSD
jgi:hypothetical protein